MKCLSCLILLFFLNSVKAEEKYFGPHKEIEKEICFKALKKGKIIDKQKVDLKERRHLAVNDIQYDIIYQNKYYTLYIYRELWVTNTFLTDTISCYIWEGNKK
tara:strand:+ start:103 stop:411 length:309 start_codon:yes stop_codon:yes gene_type:complete